MSGKEKVLPEVPAGPESHEPPTPTPGAPPKQLTEAEIQERRRNNETLRQELEQVNARAREHETALNQERERATRLEAERTQIIEERDARKKEVEDLRRQSSTLDPMSDPEIQKFNNDWDGLKKSTNLKLRTAGMKAGHLEANIPTMLKLFGQMGDPDGPNFDDKRDEFNRAVGEAFPGKEDMVTEFIAKSFDMQKGIAARMSELSTNGGAIRSEREKEAYRGILKSYEDKEQTFFRPTADLRENDPFAAEVIVSELLDSSEETKKGKNEIIKFCRACALPPEPLDPKELAKMPLEDQTRYLQARQQNRVELADRVQRMMPTALASLRLLPGVYKSLLEARAEIRRLRGDSPPPPSGEPHVEEEQHPETVEGFTPSNPELDKALGRPARI